MGKILTHMADNLDGYSAPLAPMDFDFYKKGVMRSFDQKEFFKDHREFKTS